MPALDNPRHERFAQELAKGKTADEAYQEAGYKADRSNAAKLTTNNLIRARVSQIQERLAMRAEVTAESLIAEAEEVRIAAMASGQLAAAVAAIREKGVLSGERIEKAERGKAGEFAGLDSAAAVREAIAARLGVAKGKRLDS